MATCPRLPTWSPRVASEKNPEIWKSISYMIFHVLIGCSYTWYILLYPYVLRMLKKCAHTPKELNLQCSHMYAQRMPRCITYNWLMSLCWPPKTKHRGAQLRLVSSSGSKPLVSSIMTSWESLEKLGILRSSSFWMKTHIFLIFPWDFSGKSPGDPMHCGAEFRWSNPPGHFPAPTGTFFFAPAISDPRSAGPGRHSFHTVTPTRVGLRGAKRCWGSEACFLSPVIQVFYSMMGF